MSFYPPGHAPLLARFGVVVLTMAIASLARAAMSPLVGNRFPFLTFFPAIMLSAWYGGFWAGVACTLLAAFLLAWLWLEPDWAIALESSGDEVALAIFVATGGAIAGFHEILHRERARLRAARVEAERTAALAQRAQHEADVSNRAKDEFLSILSHELRTPLTAVLGWANVLRTRKTDAATQARALETIERNASAQARIIEDILEVSRIVTGKLRLDLQPVDPIAVVSAAFDAAKPAAKARGITLEAAFGPDVGMIHADPDRLQQITGNLLVNAIKFTPSGGRVEVRVERQLSQLRLCVTDTGLGISGDFLPHVFDRFRQADASATRAHGGLGLGLAIVKHLADLHGGTITAQSEGIDKGAKFTLSLPIWTIQLTNERAGVSEAGRQNAACVGAVSLDGVRVLVVDDEPDTRELIAAILEDRGARVARAGSAAEALRALEAWPVDVLVSDIGMPGEDGYALMHKVSAMLAETKGHIPALALTAYAGPEVAKRVQAAGFEGYLVKPFLVELLVQTVAQLALNARPSPAPPPRGAPQA